MEEGWRANTGDMDKQEGGGVEGWMDFLRTLRKNPWSRDVWIKPRRVWRHGHMLTCRENRCLKTELPGVDALRSEG